MTTSSVKAMLHTGGGVMLVLVFVFAAPACSHTLIGRGVEPPMIMVRNSTGTDLAEASLSEAGGGNVSRYGSISPVPKGASQVVGRGTDSRQFPRTVNLQWIDDQGNRHSREFSLTKVLRTATGTKGEALVFDIHSQGDVDVYLELTTSSSAQEMDNIEWRLIEVAGREISPPAGEKWPFMKLDPVKKQAAAFAGCNNFFAGYTREGASLSFGLIGSTQRACEGAQNETERDFLKALGSTRSWQIVDGVLILSADEALARFKRADGK